MSQAPSVAFAALDEETPVGAPAKGDGHREHVSLRGTTRGLEILSVLSTVFGEQRR